MRQRNMFIPVGMAVLAAVGATLWSQGVFENEPEFPRSMCNGFVDGDRVKSLLLSHEGELTEDSGGFPMPKPPAAIAHCEIRLGDGTVAISAKYPSEDARRQEVFKEADRKATLGSAFGELKDSGFALLYVPCPNREDPEALLSIGASADSADREYAPAKSVDRAGKGLADLTAQVTRSLAQRHFKCQGAKRLPQGSLRISPALGGNR